MLSDDRRYSTCERGTSCAANLAILRMPPMISSFNVSLPRGMDLLIASVHVIIYVIIPQLSSRPKTSHLLRLINFVTDHIRHARPPDLCVRRNRDHPDSPRISRASASGS